MLKRGRRQHRQDRDMLMHNRHESQAKPDVSIGLRSSRMRPWNPRVRVCGSK